jgi:hypothetical protein
MSEEKFHIKLVCQRTGLTLGSFYPKSTLAGLSPYVKAWKETVSFHPIFAANIYDLLHRAKSNFQLAKNGRREWPMQQQQLMMLALLHAADVVIQDFPCLPSPRITATYLAEVLEVVSWKYEHGSDRLKFPKLHIWKGAAGELEKDPFYPIPVWLRAARECIKDYNDTVRIRVREAKKKAEELAIKQIRRNLYEDISLRRLWSWLTTQIPNSELIDGECERLFFCAEKNIHVWTEQDIQDLEDLFLTHCETGNSVSYEVSRRIEQLKHWLAVYNDTFEILLDNPHPELTGTPAPEVRNFPNRAAWLVAKAKWDLANKKQSNVGENDL